MNSVRFNYADIKPISLKDKKVVKTLIVGLFEEEGKKLKSINYIFCSDEYLLQINQRFLNHDYYTDIITFNLSTGDEITGEVYISTDRVKENSISLSVSFKDELLRVVFHGALHLCGYRDKKKSEIIFMRAKEEYYLLKTR